MPRCGYSCNSEESDPRVDVGFLLLVTIICMVFLVAAGIIVGTSKPKVLVNITNRPDEAPTVFENLGSGVEELQLNEAGIDGNDTGIGNGEAVNATSATLPDVEGEVMTHNIPTELTTESDAGLAGAETDVPERVRIAARRVRSITTGLPNGGRLQPSDNNNVEEPCRKFDLVLKPADIGLHHVVSPKFINLGYCVREVVTSHTSAISTTPSTDISWTDSRKLRGDAPFLPESTCVGIACDDIRVVMKTKDGTCFEEILPSVSVTECGCR